MLFVVLVVTDKLFMAFNYKIEQRVKIEVIYISKSLILTRLILLMVYSVRVMVMVTLM